MFNSKRDTRLKLDRPRTAADMKRIGIIMAIYASFVGLETRFKKVVANKTTFVI
jgi:hypothetical protein